MTIKEILEKKKMSQIKLARIAQVPACSLNQIINGKLHPCPAWRRRISEALGLNEYEIFAKEVRKDAPNEDNH